MAWSATLVVDRTDDNASAAAQACTASASDCSLRGAILKANATAGADTIQFSGNAMYTLTIPGDDDAAAQGDLDVTDSLTITGNGAANTIIQAGTNASNGIDKVFGLNPTCAPNVHVTMTGVTVRFGRNTFAHTNRRQLGGDRDEGSPPSPLRNSRYASSGLEWPRCRTCPLH